MSSRKVEMYFASDAWSWRESDWLDASDASASCNARGAQRRADEHRRNVVLVSSATKQIVARFTPGPMRDGNYVSDAEKATWHSWKVGDYVEGGRGEGFDVGTVTQVNDGATVTVAWSSGVRTDTPASELRPSSADKYREWVGQENAQA